MVENNFKLPERKPVRRRLQPGEIDYTPYTSPASPPAPTQASTSTPTSPAPVPPAPAPERSVSEQQTVPAPEPQKVGPKNKHINLSLPISVIEQAKTTWAHVAYIEEQPRFAHFVAEALRKHISDMEEKHNDGKPYPQTSGGVILPTGAPPQQ